jgi:triphosphatase
MPEVELKLALSSIHYKAALASLRRRAGAGAATNKRLNSVYFDTSALALHSAGMSLRVRAENGAAVQTAKRETVGGSIERDEWEDTIAREAPDLEAGKSGRVVRGVIGKRVALKPQFRVRVTRIAIDMQASGGSRVEAALDRGWIEATANRERCRVHELELELKKGDHVAALFDVALALAKTIPLQIECRSKAERGYALLASDGAPRAIHSPAIPLKKKQTLGEALKAAGRVYLDQFVRNIPAAQAGAPEAVHQMRVALRRLRSTLSFAREDLPEHQYQWAKERLKGLLQGLGPVRNWEVLHQELADIPSVEQRRTAAHRRLRDAAGQRAQSAHARATHAVLSPAATRVVLELWRWFEHLETPLLQVKLRDAAGPLLDKQFRRMRKRAKGFADLDAEKRHRLRIACKNMRYTAELFGQLYPRKAAKRFLKRLKPAQDGLGALNDVRGAHALLTELSRDHPRRVALPAGKVLGWLDREALETQAKAANTIRRLRAAPRFW